MRAVLLMRNVWKRFSGTDWVLKGVNLEIESGEAVLITGPNGSGKTTILRIAAGLTRPSKGLVSVCGREPWSIEAKRCRAVVLHWSLLYDELTVRENLDFYAAIYGVPRGSWRTVASVLRLDERLEQVTSTLSFGWRRRGDLARAITVKPKLVLIDEPLTGLDDDAASSLTQLLAKVKRDGAAILMTMPRLDERLFGLVDKHYELVDGRLVEKPVP